MRCAWVPEDDQQYVDYHDLEWGRPATTAQAIFEKLCLEGFQSGLSWLTILRKRESFRDVFAGFDIEKVAHMGEGDIAELLSDERIVRHRGKIAATINNAQCIQSLGDSSEIVRWFWRWASPEPSFAESLEPSASAVDLAKALKKMGWKFVGPTTVYAFMQSEGLVNDHERECVSFAACEAERSQQFSSLG